MRQSMDGNMQMRAGALGKLTQVPRQFADCSSFFLWIMNYYESFLKAVNPSPEQSRNKFQRVISEGYVIL